MADKIVKSEDKIVKSEEEWRAQLTREQFRVTRGHATEPPFSGKLLDCKSPGTYRCVCCGQALFDSDAKYDSRSGWPSFWRPVAEDAIGSVTDETLGMVRTEVHCSRCDAHIGHVFPDGPQPTGLRYCLNSASLALEPREDG